MRAVQITGYDGPAMVEVVEAKEPAPGEDEVLIDVRAAGIAYPQLLQSRGEYQIQPPLPFIPGSEVAGVVLAAPETSGYRAGDRVVATPQVGGFAERATVSMGMVFSLPDGVEFETGAAVPLNYFTAHFALARRGRLTRGETVVVHGASGGVGTASIQVANALGAERVIAITSTDAKGEAALAAGASSIALADGFKDAVLEATGGDGVDVVVDPVGGERMTDSLRILRPEGRILVLGFTEGSIPSVRVNRLLLNNIDVMGVGWGALVRKSPAIAKSQWEFLTQHLGTGTIRPPVHRVEGLCQVHTALSTLEGRGSTGKMVLVND